MPTTPTLSVLRISSTAFQATISSDPGALNTLYYRYLGMGTDVEGPMITGPGVAYLTGLVANGAYMVYVVSDDGHRSLPAIQFVSLISSETLSAAIKGHWENNPTLNTYAGRLYLDEIPEVDESGNPISFPYTELNIGKTFFDYTFTTEEYEITLVNFSVYAIGGENAERGITEIREFFKFQTQLPFPTTVTVKIEPVDYYVESQFVRARDGAIVYCAHLSYTITVAKQTT